jgi:hypothetical protein
VGVFREGAGGRGGEITQTLYAHMKKKKKECNPLVSDACLYFLEPKIFRYLNKDI